MPVLDPWHAVPTRPHPLCLDDRIMRRARGPSRERTQQKAERGHQRKRPQHLCRGLSINTRASISRILFPRASTRDSAIYLGSRSRETSIDLPAGIKRAALIPSEDGNPSLFGLSARGVYQAASLTRGTGGLLPHLFILTSPKPWRKRASTSASTVGGFPFCGTFHGTTVTSGTPSR